jgi:hypothetical protein
MEVIWPDYYPYRKNSQRKVLPAGDDVQMAIITWVGMIERQKMFIRPGA